MGSGKGCRYHGAHKPNMVKRGANHPRYRHGGETLEVKAERHDMAVFFHKAESLMSRLGMLALGSARTRGQETRKVAVVKMARASEPCRRLLRQNQSRPRRARPDQARDP